MLSIGKLVPGAESYYLLTVARGREEYYTGVGEAPGYWVGRGADAVGLAGEVEPRGLSSLLAGHSPVDGSSLISRRPNTKRVAGFDLTFSAPKSVSLLFGLTSSEVSASVRQAHDRAVAAGMDYLEAHALAARRGDGGIRRIATDGAIAAAFRHRTSRAGDPQLHTHVLVANVVQGQDGRYCAPDARLLYHHGRTAGYVYQAALRYELATSLGVSFTPVVNGVAEVAGVVPEAIRAFSTRRAEIEAHLANQLFDGPRSAQFAALETRAAKVRPGAGNTVEAAAELIETWRKRAAELGHDPDAFDLLVGSGREVDYAGFDVDDIAKELTGAGGLTAQASTFERRDVVREVASRLPDGAPPESMESWVNQVVAYPEVVALNSLGRGGEQRLTTVELLAVEDDLIDLAASGKGAGVSTADPAILHAVLETHESLSAEQAAMVQTLTTSGDTVQVVIGAAGAGKTFALAVAREVWEASGHRVTGAALAARAANQLEAGAGIPSSTLAALEIELASGRDAFDLGDVLVVDEAAMVGTRTLSRVVGTVTAQGAAVVLVGDHRQLPEIDTGGAFAGIGHALGAVELTDNRRQSIEWARRALGELRHGDVSVGLAAFDESGHLHSYGSGAEAQRALVADWFAWRSECPDDEVAIYASRRADVHALNAEARRVLHDHGRIGPDIYMTSDGLAFAEGDEIVFLRNDRRMGVVNGTRGHVMGADSDGLIVVVPKRVLRVEGSYIDGGHLSHGYATTIHKAQGATVDRAFVYATASLYREAGYVALSRAREASDLYVVHGAFETGIDDDIDHGRRPETARPLLEALEVSRAKSMARDELGPARESQGIGDDRLLENLRPLGARPADTKDRGRWDRAREAIESYRRLSGFDGPTPLGPLPDDEAMRAEWRRAVDVIVEHARHRDVERGIELRSRGQGLSI